MSATGKSVPQRLAASTTLPDNVALPGYNPADSKTGIVHFGLGAFHRGHMAVYTDDVLAAHGGDWRICGISLRSPSVRDRLQPQDCRYTLVERGETAEKLRSISCVAEVLVAPEDPQAVLNRLCSPEVKIISFTITEKGYLRDPASGDLLASYPDILHDLENPQAPRTMHGFVIEALARRRAAGLAPVTLLCCDNLPANGLSLRQAVLGFARLRDTELAAWIEENIAFPCTMVDRIVPATTAEDITRTANLLGCLDEAPVICEPFCQWVIEDSFSSPRPAWEEFGASLVSDVAPYEEMKLRLLNSSHSAMAYLGYLGGIATIDAVINTDEYCRYVQRLMAEVLPTLQMPDGVDLQAYCDALIARFRNPNLKHRTWQIAMDGSQKIPQRILNTIRYLLESGADFPCLALAVAGWLRYVTGRDEQGATIDVSDPLAGRLRRIADSHNVRNNGENQFDIAAYVAEVLQLEEVFGSDLAANAIFHKAVEDGLAEIVAHGARAAVSRLANEA